MLDTTLITEMTFDQPLLIMTIKYISLNVERKKTTSDDCTVLISKTN